VFPGSRNDPIDRKGKKRRERERVKEMKKRQTVTGESLAEFLGGGFGRGLRASEEGDDLLSCGEGTGRGLDARSCESDEELVLGDSPLVSSPSPPPPLSSEEALFGGAGFMLLPLAFVIFSPASAACLLMFCIKELESPDESGRGDCFLERVLGEEVEAAGDKGVEGFGGDGGDPERRILEIERAFSATKETLLVSSP